MVDYSSTHMHNPVVVSHKHDEPEDSAFDIAERETQKTMKRTHDWASSRDDLRKKSVERGAKAMEQLAAKKFAEEFEKEMEQLQKAQNDEKIKEGMRNPSAEYKPATMLARRQNKDRQAEKAFEEIFGGPPHHSHKTGLATTVEAVEELEDSKIIVKHHTRPRSTLRSKSPKVRSVKNISERDRSQERPSSSSQAKLKSDASKQPTAQPANQAVSRSQSATRGAKTEIPGPGSITTNVKQSDNEKSPISDAKESPLSHSKSAISNQPESTNRNNESVKSYPPQLISNDSNPNFLRTNPFLAAQYTQSSVPSNFPQGSLPYGFDPQQAVQFTGSGYPQYHPGMAPFMGVSYAVGYPSINTLGAPVNFQSGYPGQQFPYWPIQQSAGYNVNSGVQQSTGSSLGLQQQSAATLGLQQSAATLGLQQSAATLGLQQSSASLGIQQSTGSIGSQQPNGGLYQPENSGITGQFPLGPSASGALSGPKTQSNAISADSSIMSSEFGYKGEREPDHPPKHPHQVNHRMTPQFQHSLRNQVTSPTSDSALDLDHFGLKNYIQEQEDYLKKLDQDRKRLIERSTSNDNRTSINERSSSNINSLREVYENKREEQAKRVENKSESIMRSSYPSTNHSTRKSESEVPGGARRSHEAVKKVHAWTKSFDKEEEEEEEEEEEDQQQEREQEQGEEEEEEKSSSISLDENGTKLAELKKKTDELLERFLKPKANTAEGFRKNKEQVDEEDEEEEEEKKNAKSEDDENLLAESSPESIKAKHKPKGVLFEPSNFINPNLVKEQPKPFKREEAPNRYFKVETDNTPNKIVAKKIRDLHGTSPSELDYSLSDKDKSEKKLSIDKSTELQYSKNNIVLSKEPTNNSDSAKTFMEFSFKNQPFSSSLGNEKNTFNKSNKENSNMSNLSKTGWRMEFNNFSQENEEEEKTTKKINIQEEQDEDDDQPQNEDEFAQDKEEKGLSLAELFKRNKRDFVSKYENQQKATVPKEEKDLNKGKRSKEEILKKRKEMMEYRGPMTKKKTDEDEDQQNPKDLNNSRKIEKKPSGDEFGFKSKSKSKEPRPELLDRLAGGKKTKVDQKEMKALTQKNYELLPEIKKRKEEEKKKEEFKKRQEMVKKLDQKVRSNMVKTSLK